MNMAVKVFSPLPPNLSMLMLKERIPNFAERKEELKLGEQQLKKLQKMLKKLSKTKLKKLLKMLKRHQNR